MLNYLITTLGIPVILLTLMLVPTYLIVYVFRFSTRKKKSPLNIDLLRSPGQTLSEQIEDLSVDIIGHLLLTPLIISVLYAMYSTLYTTKSYEDRLTAGVMYIGGGLCIAGFAIYKVYSMIKDRNNKRLGRECEVFVGQGLTNLMKHGFNVYHDFPADGNFNIDHIAIGPTGVFAIETKGKSKQVKAEKQNWKVKYNGVSLEFPSWTDTADIGQAKRQAKWLSSWVESSTGEEQQVYPVLALPGWWIDTIKPGKVRVYNGKNPEFMARGQRLLTDARIRAISHQVEGKCRDVKAEFYKKSNE